MQCTELSGSGFEPWEAAIDELPKLSVAAGAGQLRARLEALPPFPLETLLGELSGSGGISNGSSSGASAGGQGELSSSSGGGGGGGGGGSQLWRAYSVLSFLSHGYLWCDGPDTPQRLPAVLAVPWAAVSRALDMPPVLVYATYNLLNWRRLDPSGPVALGNIVCLNNFLGGVDEEWFRLVHVSIEAAAGPAVAGLEDLQAAARRGDAGAVEAHLRTMHEALQRMQALLSRMGEKCDPYVYYTRVRQPMSGWRGNDRLPGGLMYEDVGGPPLQLYGETGAQSSVVSAMDAALGIEHECGWLRDYLDTMRLHMPPPHRRLIDRLEASNAVAAAAAAAGSGVPATPRGMAMAGAAAGVREAYNEVVAELEAFRAQHRAFAAQYIANFSAKEKGTGGSDFMPALAGYRKTTAKHRLPTS